MLFCDSEMEKSYLTGKNLLKSTLFDLHVRVLVYYIIVQLKFHNNVFTIYTCITIIMIIKLYGKIVLKSWLGVGVRG